MDRATNHKIAGTALRTLINGNGAAANTALLQNLREKFSFDYNNPPLTLFFEDYVQIIEYIRQALFPTKTPDDGYEAMGQGIVEDYFQGAVGQVNKIAANVMGPERAAQLFVKNMATTLPFGRHELEEVGKGYARYHIYNIAGPPALVRGMIRASLESAGANTLAISSTVISANEFIHEARWS